MLHFLKKTFQKFPFHLLLLPAFFICSKYVQYQGLLEINAVWKGALIIFAVLAGFFLINYLLLKDFNKSAIASSCLGFIFLFFGDLREFLQESRGHFLSLYKIFLPILAILFLALFITLKKTSHLYKTNLFLNLLLVIFIITEIAKMVQLNRSNHSGFAGKILTVPVPNSLKKKLPDIYYIVPDCYPSSSYQAEMLNTSNDYFDSALKEKGFRVLPESRSNYNRTAFSMSATFSMLYPSWVTDQNLPVAADYNRAINNVKFSQLFDFFQKNGYNTVNLSIFDLGENPALRKEKFLSATSSEMIFRFTFWNYFSRDILFSWVIDKKKYKAKQQQLHFKPLKKYSQQVVDSLIKGTIKNSSHPQFIYAHLSFPHFPYFYDSSGRAYNDNLLYNDSIITDRKKFTGYIKYSNNQLLQIVSSILTKTNGNAVILMQSDHGLSDLDVSRKNDAFRNYTAFYFPDKDYSMVYDSMSNVNTFRIVLNKYFGQHLQVLADSSIYVGIH
ncbi:MAG: sulfatase-like hydrolase/transferase [Lacibacter sp.]